MKYLWFGLCLFICIVLGLFVLLRPAPLPEETVTPVEALLREATALKGKQQFAKAEQLAGEAIQLAPDNIAAIFLAAEVCERQNKYDEMFAYVDLIPQSEESAWLKGHLIEAGVKHYKMANLKLAEAAYREVLEIAPDHPHANEGIARLLALVGRRHEAIPHILTLIRGGTQTDLLMLLGRDSGVLTDENLIKQALNANPDDPYPLLAQAWQAASEMQTEQAISLLNRAKKADPTLPAIWAAFGKQLWAAGKSEELAEWQKNLPAGTDQSPEVWQVQGNIANSNGQFPEAIRCFWEAIKLNPESKEATTQLARLLAETGKTEQAEQFRQRVVELQQFEEIQSKALFSRQQPTYDDLVAYVQKCLQVGRLWEAYAWGQVAFEIDPESPQLLQVWPELLRVLPSQPLVLTVPEKNPGLQLDLSSYPLPKQSTPQLSSTEMETIFRNISFQEAAESTGLDFHYFNGSPRDKPERKIYEFTGGGAGVIDFDLDGFPDVYLTQGRTDFEKSLSESDALFRNLDGKGFVDCSASAGILETEFSQGVAIGDYNSDGFADILVGNIGANCLWLNEGDGTFTNATVEAGLTGNVWTTSCLIADLNGDTHPDLYEVNYLKGPDLFSRVCQDGSGNEVMCLPFDFPGETDQVWLNDGSGKFTNATNSLVSISPNGKGLGILAWDAEGSGQLSVLITNDTTPNFLFTPEVKDGQSTLVERGILSGIALNSQGKAEGSMGIAVADIDEDGQLDIHITNFLAETNTLYKTTSPGFYSDRTDELGLAQSTFSELGFGTQFLDANLDGSPELFVANGHVDDLQFAGKPYRMKQQLFYWTGTRFEQFDGQQLGEYFNSLWLGRACARMDWNRDGLPDLVVGQLTDRTALLTNTSTETGNFLTIRLIGTQSSRDPIGATLTMNIGQRAWTQQLTAGDGYQSSNEHRITFGIGSAQKIDQLIIKWPSGKQQTFKDIPAAQQLIVCEGDAAYFSEANP